MRSFVLFNGLFYKVLFMALGLSVISKALVNFAIEPVDHSLTHAEHWHEGWPDPSDGILGKISSNLGGFIELFVSYDNVEVLIFIALFILIFGPFALSTIGKSRTSMTPLYLGLGLILAAGISNQEEIALFGHSTDFLLIRISSAVVIANLADFMVLIGIILIVFPETCQKMIGSLDAVKKTFGSD